MYFHLTSQMQLSLEQVTDIIIWKALTINVLAVADNAADSTAFVECMIGIIRDALRELVQTEQVREQAADVSGMSETEMRTLREEIDAEREAAQRALRNGRRME